MSSSSGRRRGRPRVMRPLPPPRQFPPGDIERLRRELSRRSGLKRPLSRSEFGELFGVSRSIVHAWEAGAKKPSSSARRLMEILDLVEHIGNALILKHGGWRKRLEQRAEDEEQDG